MCTHNVNWPYMRRMWSLTDSIDKQMMSVTLWIPVLYNGEFACIPLWPSNDFIHCLAIRLKFPTACINLTSLDGIENTAVQACFDCCYAPCWFLRTRTWGRISCIYVDNQTKCHCRHLEIQTETVWRRLSSLLVIFLSYKLDILACDIISEFSAYCFTICHPTCCQSANYLLSWKGDS